MKYDEDIVSFSGEERHDLPFWITMAGYSRCNGDYHITRLCSDITVLEYIVDGQGYIYYEGQWLCAKKGDIYLLPHSRRHDYYADRKDPWKKIFINIGGIYATELIHVYGLNGALFNGGKCRQLFEEIFFNIFDSSGVTEKQEKLCAGYIKVLMRLAHQSYNTAHSPEAVKCREYLENNTDRIIGNDEIAEQIFSSVDHTVKLFKKEYGMTPYEYHLSYKMQIARQLLQNTKMSVAEIAYTVGYFDQHYFSNLFKKRCGVSPRQYRNMNS